MSGAARLTRRAALTLAAGAAWQARALAAPSARRPLGGVNLSGLELTPQTLPGRANFEYTAPSAAELDYFHAAGARVVRIPFLWERAQPALGAPLEEGYLGLLDRLVAQTRARGMKIVLDAHQFGRRRGEIIGEAPGAPASAFAGFWAAIAKRYGAARHAIFNLTNEPNSQDLDRLVGTQNAAIAAIRATGARHLILVSGTGWSGAHSWISSGNAAAMARIADRAGNVAFDVHQYLDGDSSGTHAECAAGAGKTRLAAFTEWARGRRQRGFLGECGGGAAAACLAELDALIAHVNAHPDVWVGWTAWGGGAWWPDSYFMALDPGKDHTDRPQMRLLRKRLRAAA